METCTGSADTHQTMRDRKEENIDSARYNVPGGEAVDALIRTRRTIHLFEEGVPPQGVILQAIDLACRAPNHRLTEPWRFYLAGRQTITAIAVLNAGIVAETKGAAAGAAKLERWGRIPGMVVVTSRRSDDPIREREDFAACCCAIQNFMLYLWSEGVGVKWTTGLVVRDFRFYRLIEVSPDEEEVVGLLWYGYPKEIPETPRTPAERFVVRLP